MKLIIFGNCPSGKNSIKTTRTGQRYPSQRFTAWRDHAVIQLRSQWKGRKAIDYPVSLEIYYHPGDKRRRDVPGIVDCLFHAMERAGIVTDDTFLGGSGHELRFKTDITDVRNPRVEIEILLDE